MYEKNFDSEKRSATTQKENTLQKPSSNKGKYLLMKPRIPDLLRTAANDLRSKKSTAKKPTQMMTKEIVFKADLFV